MKCVNPVSAWLVLIAVPLSAQTAHKRPSSSAFTLVSVSVSGSQRYKPEDIIAASGLQIGQPAGEADFQAASQRLGESGAFSNVSYSYKYSGEGAKLELQVADSEHWVPVRFDNIVWFSDQELMEKLRARVPLFQGQLPLDGDLPDKVSDALQALLVERSVAGRADYLRAGESGHIDAIVYSVSGTTIRMRNAEFTGAGPAELPLLQAAGAKLHSQDFLRSILRVQEDRNFLPIYLARGYLKASFADAQAKVVEQSDQETDVDITFAVEPGLQYKASQIELAGTKVLPADELRKLLHQQLGQPANAVQLADDLETVKKLYRAHGYMAAATQAIPSFDDAQSAVSYQLLVKEGDLYHMGDLDVQDLDAREGARVAAKWTLAKGAPYDSSYPKRFIAEVLKTVLVDGEWNVSVREMPEAADKTVDVNIKFERKAAM